MGSTIDYIEFVMDQLDRLPFVFRYKKMFGEYCVYANDKPIILVCDNRVFVKMLPCIESILSEADIDTPYNGAKPHYVLDVEDATLLSKVIPLLESNTPLPKPRKPKTKK